LINFDKLNFQLKMKKRFLKKSVRSEYFECPEHSLIHSKPPPLIFLQKIMKHDCDSILRGVTKRYCCVCCGYPVAAVAVVLAVVVVAV
jgi:hypothetical protein